MTGKGSSSQQGNAEPRGRRVTQLASVKPPRAFRKAPGGSLEICGVPLETFESVDTTPFGPTTTRPLLRVF